MQHGTVRPDHNDYSAPLRRLPNQIVLWCSQCKSSALAVLKGGPYKGKGGRWPKREGEKQSKVKRGKAMQSEAKQSEAKRNEAKQSKAKQNKQATRGRGGRQQEQQQGQVQWQQQG
jgi:hypothetical protein